MTKNLSTDESIQAMYPDEEPTLPQAKWLIGLYRDKLKSKILKRHSRIQDAKTSDYPYYRGICSFAIHFINTYSVENSVLRGATSTMIQNALPLGHPKKTGNKVTFDMKFVAKFLDSSNKWYVNRDKQTS